MISYSFIWIFLAVPIVFWWWYYQNREQWWYFPPNPLILRFLERPKIFFLLWVIRFFLVVIFFHILAWTYFVYSYIKTEKNIQYISIVLDISRSMLAEDILPSRIQVAKTTIKNFLYNHKNDSISLIVFAWKPFTAISHSHDFSGISHFLDHISPDYILQEKRELSGTNIGDALLLANMNLSKVDGEKYIILVTDGSANTGIDPLMSAEEIKKNNIPVYTISLGKDDNKELFYTDKNGRKKFFYDASGEKIIGEIDKKLLEDIAQITQGKFFGAENLSELEEAFKNADKNFIHSEEKKHITKHISLIPLFLILFLIGIFIEKKFQRYFYQKYKILK